MDCFIYKEKEKKVTKEDYMYLPKERLAEMLAEKDCNMPNEQYWIGNCPFGGKCTNKFHDCINCPIESTGGYTTSNI